jgi:CheY-like chemotaxis protein
MGKRILLADDSLTIQKVVELTLSGTEYDLTCLSNGQKALESLKASRPDLILADAVMPEKNGYEVCEAIKGNPSTARIPVVLLSGIFEPFDRERAERIGCDLVVSKPFDAQQLVEQIETLLSRSASDAPATEPPLEEAPFESPAAAFGQPPPTDLVPQEEPPFVPAHESVWSEAEGAAAPAPAPVETMAAVETVPAVEEPLPPLPEPPLETPPAEAAARPPGIEEITIEEAEALFDLPSPAAGSPLAPEPAAEPAPEAPPPAQPLELTDEQIERIAARVVEKLSDRVIREIAWEVVPDAAEVAVKRRIAELESGTD